MARLTGCMAALLVANVLAVSGAGRAAADDFLAPPPPPLEPGLEQPFSGWYLRGDVGVGFDQMSAYHSSADTAPNYADNGHGLGRQAVIGGGIGYALTYWFRADITGEYRTPTKYWALASYNLGSDAYAASIPSGVILANGYIDFGTWFRVTPFIGAGVGAAFHSFDGFTDTALGPQNLGGYGSGPTRNSVAPAWALMAGFAYSFSPNWKLEISYRYLDMGHLSNTLIWGTGGVPETQSFHMASQDIRLGLRYAFTDVPTVAPPVLAPLVRKY